MDLNFLECLGVIMALILVYGSIICLYYLIKDAIDKWKEVYRNKCPFCGAYLHGYQHKRKGAKYDARYCSRCGRALNETENTFDPIKFRKELRSLLLCSNEYRKKVKRFSCKSCELFGNDCDGVSGYCDCAYIIVDHTQKGEKNNEN